jgi:hypothetical protein
MSVPAEFSSIAKNARGFVSTQNEAFFSRSVLRMSPEAPESVAEANSETDFEIFFWEEF